LFIGLIYFLQKWRTLSAIQKASFFIAEAQPIFAFS